MKEEAAAVNLCSTKLQVSRFTELMLHYEITRRYCNIYQRKAVHVLSNGAGWVLTNTLQNEMFAI